MQVAFQKGEKQYPSSADFWDCHLIQRDSLKFVYMGSPFLLKFHHADGAGPEKLMESSFAVWKSPCPEKGPATATVLLGSVQTILQGRGLDVHGG